MDRQTNGQADKWTDSKWTGRQMDRQTNVQTDKWTGRQTYKWTGRQTDKLDRQTDRFGKI
jgi:hypothetical protein